MQAIRTRNFNPPRFDSFSQKIRHQVSKPLYYRENLHANTDGVIRSERNKQTRLFGRSEITSAISNEVLGDLVSYAHERSIEIDYDDMKMYVIVLYLSPILHYLIIFTQILPH